MLRREPHSAAGLLKAYQVLQIYQVYQAFQWKSRDFNRFQVISWDFKGFHSEEHSDISRKTILADIL